ncbi:unnamed protein product [Linum tenue]|uniref:Palmitoyltransferase n=1 Tax=Linum tenue TaxID=586396 RepID=A0AAV0HJK4_9ROSI|nr:unnamed protein product [Linum tenue]
MPTMHRSGAAMAWNVFKFCTALRGLGSIMILLVLGVVGVTYYAVVLTNYGPALYDGGLDSLIALFVLILFHCLLIMLLWSYFSVVLTDPGSVPPNWRPSTDEERGEADPLNGQEFNSVQTDLPKPRAYEKKTTPKWRYDLGRRRNFEQVLGTDKWYWFIPAYSDEDLRRMPALQGLEYPSKPDFDSEEF